MPEGRWKQFLLEQPRTAKLATTRKDGSPHVAAVYTPGKGIDRQGISD